MGIIDKVFDGIDYMRGYRPVFVSMEEKETSVEHPQSRPDTVSIQPGDNASEAIKPHTLRQLVCKNGTKIEADVEAEKITVSYPNGEKQEMKGWMTLPHTNNEEYEQGKWHKKDGLCIKVGDTFERISGNGKMDISNKKVLGNGDKIFFDLEFRLCPKEKYRDSFMEKHFSLNKDGSTLECKYSDTEDRIKLPINPVLLFMDDSNGITPEDYKAVSMTKYDNHNFIVGTRGNFSMY